VTPSHFKTIVFFLWCSCFEHRTLHISCIVHTNWVLFISFYCKICLQNYQH